MTDSNKEKQDNKAPYREKARGKRVDGLFEEIMTYLKQEHRYRDHSLTTARLAKELHTNTRYIAAVVAESTGDNYNVLINKMRLNDAEKMLRSRRYDRMTVEEIAIIAGFATRQSFHAVFNKHYGCTPAHYRRTVHAARKKCL